MKKIFIVLIVTFLFALNCSAKEVKSIEDSSVSISDKKSATYQSIKASQEIVSPRISLVPVGTVIIWASDQDIEDSDKWLECNGQEVDKKRYPDLYKLMHYTPDYSSYFLRGGDSTLVNTKQDTSTLRSHTLDVGTKVETIVPHTHEYTLDYSGTVPSLAINDTINTIDIKNERKIIVRRKLLREAESGEEKYKCGTKTVKTECNCKYNIYVPDENGNTTCTNNYLSLTQDSENCNKPRLPIGGIPIPCEQCIFTGTVKDINNVEVTGVILASRISYGNQKICPVKPEYKIGDPWTDGGIIAKISSNCQCSNISCSDIFECKELYPCTYYAKLCETCSQKVAKYCAIVKEELLPIELKKVKSATYSNFTNRIIDGSIKETEIIGHYDGATNNEIDETAPKHKYVRYLIRAEL